jgi:hypothetical protein
MAKQMAADHPPKQVMRTSKRYWVPIPEMRVAPAGVAQREFVPSWGDYLAKNLRLEELGFPVINHRDKFFWIIDGQHRIHALKENGFGNDSLECEVYENLTDEQMAAIFDGRNTQKHVNKIDKFLVRCTRGNKRENDIRRVIESNGAKISRYRDAGCVNAVGACEKIYDLAGDTVLGQVIRTLGRAYDLQPSGFDGSMIEGTGLIYNRFNGKTNEKRLVEQLSSLPKGIQAITHRANALRLHTGAQRSQCIAAAIVETYNRGLPGTSRDRLPSWWKEAVKAEK